MQIGMIGLGRMGANMARRLLGDRHDCVVHDIDPEPVRALVQAGATAADSIAALAAQLGSPRLVWLMLPAPIVDETIGALVSFLEPGDTVVDGGNSHFHDDVRRAEELRRLGIHYVDVGTSGGVWGLENGYCQMIGGEPAIVKRLEPVFASLAPPVDAVTRTPGRQQRGTGAERGYLHCGPSGAGHFAKMVHNGIEYGMLQAYGEGFEILRFSQYD
ncbi:MAG: NADP-dependent phosphogluconate dehydrogenase, partial [Burkholderiales bacterium]